MCQKVLLSHNILTEYNTAINSLLDLSIQVLGFPSARRATMADRSKCISIWCFCSRGPNWFNYFDYYFWGISGNPLFSNSPTYIVFQSIITIISLFQMIFLSLTKFWKILRALTFSISWFSFLHHSINLMCNCLVLFYTRFVWC